MILIVDEDTSAAVDAVRSYVLALREIRSRLFADLPGMAGVQDIMVAVRSQRTMARESRTAGGIEYSVHGAGCRMTDEDGRVVDVDLVRDPHTAIEVEAFDVWRIKSFLSSNRCHPPADGELNTACEQLAARGELRVVQPGRWFALPLT
ncbi:hypothetical protein [Nocardia sp. NRRL S-836]|uniref:DUF6896 domain-containing protein n=1 Tax=Nocardia sp. NRRL S-836 TaxID=1519492 RepID=UPI0006AF59A9|nr:hypothetical protein [Nocardia sp. NRRL S-836]